MASRDGDNLIFTFDDASKLILDSFYAVYNTETLPSFTMAGNQLSGADFLASLFGGLQTAAVFAAPTAVPAWFDSATYLKNKLASLQESDPTYTSEKLIKVMNDVGYVGEAGFLQHMKDYGSDEGIAPNALFNSNEYLINKTADFFASQDGKVTTMQLDYVEKAFKAAGLSAVDHYNLYGSKENINPSFSFNAKAYAADKSKAMNGSLTGTEIIKAIDGAGMTVVDHFIAYAGKGPGEVKVSYKDVSAGVVKNPYPTPAPPVVESAPGDSYTLTTNKDAIVATLRDDIFLAKVAATGSTLGAEDWFNGRLGTDTLKVSMSASYGGLTSPTSSALNVETVELKSDGLAQHNFSVKSLYSVTNYVIESAGYGVNLTNVNLTKAAVTLKGLPMGSFGYELNTAVHNATLNLTVDSVGRMTDTPNTSAGTPLSLKLATVNHLNLTLKGNNALTFAPETDLQTITMAGAGTATLDNAPQNLTNLNASAVSGQLFLNLANAKAVGVTGGTRADTIITGQGADTITGGKGADTLTGGSGNDTFNYAASGDTGAASVRYYAPPAVDVPGSVPGGGGFTVSITNPAQLDHITDIRAGDTIQLGSGKGVYQALTNQTPFLNTYASNPTASLDVCVFTTAQGTFVIFETANGSNGWGTSEAINITGTTATSFTVSADGLVSFV